MGGGLYTGMNGGAYSGKKEVKITKSPFVAEIYIGSPFK